MDRYVVVAEATWWLLGETINVIGHSLKWRCMMRYTLLLVAVLLIVGCEVDNPFTQDTPQTIVIPADADWELIATLERNPLRPSQFYIFPEEMHVINTGYVAGEHFIFEIGKEHRETYRNKIRHYIIQPTLPFQDVDKHPGQVSQWEEEGVKFDGHQYFFLSEGWYVSKPNSPAVGLGIEFDLTHFKPTEEFPGPAETLHSVTIGLINTLDNPIIGRGPSYIDGDARLRIYVSQ